MSAAPAEPVGGLAARTESAGSAAGIAALLHELSNSLGIVVGNLDLLIERQDTGVETLELARDALAGALRASDIAGKLSELGARAAALPGAAAS
jgi:hypothetical protein